MSFLCLKTSAGLPMAYTRKQSKLIALAYGALYKYAFSAHLGHLSVFRSSLDSLSTCCYSSMLLLMLSSLLGIPLLTLTSMGIFIQSFKAQRSCLLLSEPPSPVALIYHLLGSPTHTLCPLCWPLPHHILTLSLVVCLFLKHMNS